MNWKERAACEKELMDVLGHALGLTDEQTISFTIVRDVGPAIHLLRELHEGYYFLKHLDVVRSYDTLSNDVMVRIVEPNVRAYIAAMDVLGMNTSNMPKLRRSMPSPSRLQKAYSQFSHFPAASMFPSRYTNLVHEPKEPIDYERAYFLYAIEYCDGNVEQARLDISVYVKNSWQYRNAKRIATMKRPQYCYILNEDLNEREVEYWRKNGREINKFVDKEYRWHKPVSGNIEQPSANGKRVTVGIIYAWTSAMLDFLNELKSGKYIYEEAK